MPSLNRSFYTQTNNLINYSDFNKQISTNKINFTKPPLHCLSLSRLQPRQMSQLLNPWFITGFTDGEGCFGLYTYKNAALKIGWHTFRF